MTKHIPNFLTLCNLACGCFGVVAVFHGDLQMGTVMIWAGAIFDFFDGFAARMLKKYSIIGKDLDSLADLITFCFLPSTILYVLIGQNTSSDWLPYIGFLLAIFGALRLAKFNNDTRQSENFYGLPVPASAIFVSALPFILGDNAHKIHEILTSPMVLAGVAVMLSIMMVSNVKLMSFKFKNFSLADNWARFALLLISLLLLVIFQVAALPFIIIIYVVLSVVINIIE